MAAMESDGGSGTEDFHKISSVPKPIRLQSWICGVVNRGKSSAIDIPHRENKPSLVQRVWSGPQNSQ